MTDFIITFRETLEASLVVGIVLSYISQLKAREWFSTVYSAIALGVIVSLGVAFSFDAFVGAFEGYAEQLYEGVIMLLAAVLISWMILWMLKARHTISQQIKSKVDAHLEKREKIGVFFIVVVAILREGIETVLFLKASALQSGGNSIFAALLGILVAVLVGYTLFSGLKKLPMKKFFTVTSVLLILFAAGLVAHGVHELQEAGVITSGTETAWDVNPEVPQGNEYPLLHEKGTIGGLAKGLFGWNGNPTVLEVISYFVYLTLIVVVWKKRTASDI